MNLERTNLILLARVLGLLMIISLVAVIAVAGCSGKAKQAAETEAGKSADSSEGKSSQVESYVALKESILETIQKNYSARGVAITGIELEAGSGASARITLEYPEHNSDQTVLAGLRILYDNFPKLSKYIAIVEGNKYECASRVLAYLASKGMSLDTTEEEALSFLDVLNNGIPAEEEDKPIRVEAV